MANVKDDEFETLDFADEGEYIGGEDGVGGDLADEIAEMIADWFGRSVIEADRELALSIIGRLNRS